MATGDAGRRAVDDFEEFARARQDPLFRAAFLVSGDVGAAQDRLRKALTSLARHWSQVRHEHPDLFALRALYAGVVRPAWDVRRPEEAAREPVDAGPEEAWDADARDRLETALAEPVWDEPDDEWEAELGRRRDRVLRALDGLAPLGRAVLVLLFLDGRDEQEAGEVLRLSPATVAAEAQEAVALLRRGLPPGSLEDPVWRARELKDLLQLGSDGLPGADLVDGLWARSHRQHRAVVRRTVLGVGALAVAGGALTLVLREPAPERAAGPSGSTAPGPSGSPAAPSTATGTTGGRLEMVEVGGVPVFLAPDPVGERRLPNYPGAERLSLPSHLGPPDASEWAVMGKDGLSGVPEPVRAVYLVNAPDTPRPVLYAPDAPNPYVYLPDVRSEGWGYAHVRTISDDRHRLVLARWRGVIVLDARDGSTVEVEVPDPTLRTAGWARDGATIIAQGRYESWVVDPRRRRAVSAGQQPRYPDWAELALGDTSALLRTFSRNGRMTGSLELPGPVVAPNGPSVANNQQWVAGFAYLTQEYQQEAQSSQGLVAARYGPRATRRILAASRSPIVPDRCYRALTWASPSVVLLESGWQRPEVEEQLRSVLAWDVLSGRLWWVASVDRAGEADGEFTGQYAI